MINLIEVIGLIAVIDGIDVIDEIGLFYVIDVIDVIDEILCDYYDRFY